MIPILTRMRKAHLQWVEDTRDLGLLPESEIVRREQALGSRYAILRQDRGRTLMRRLRDVASAASSHGLESRQALIEAVTDEDPGVRYWAAIGLGNLAGSAENVSPAPIKLLLEDEAPCVRIAAARALSKLGLLDEALPVLQASLRSKHQWARLRAAIVLDEMDGHARPIVDDLQACLKNQPNKYITRVANRALNELLGTNHEVR